MHREVPPQPITTPTDFSLLSPRLKSVILGATITVGTVRAGKFPALSDWLTDLGRFYQQKWENLTTFPIILIGIFIELCLVLLGIKFNQHNFEIWLDPSPPSLSAWNNSHRTLFNSSRVFHSLTSTELVLHRSFNKSQPQIPHHTTPTREMDWRGKSVSQINDHHNL